MSLRPFEIIDQQFLVVDLLFRVLQSFMPLLVGKFLAGSTVHVFAGCKLGKVAVRVSGVLRGCLENWRRGSVLT